MRSAISPYSQPIMEPVVDHIHLTVEDMDAAEPFYDRLIPILGFEDHELHVVEYLHPRLGFAISSPPAAFAADAVQRRGPDALHHLAFKAQSRAEVDQMHDRVAAIGATIVSALRLFPEYTPAGTNYEIVCTSENPP